MSVATLTERNFNKEYCKNYLRIVDNTFSNTVKSVISTGVKYSSFGNKLTKQQHSMLNKEVSHIFSGLTPILLQSKMVILGSIPQSTQIRLFPLEGNKIIKCKFSMEKRDIYLYDENTKVVITLTESKNGKTTVTTSKYQNISNIVDMDNNWTKNNLRRLR